MIDISPSATNPVEEDDDFEIINDEEDDMDKETCH